MEHSSKKKKKDDGHGQRRMMCFCSMPKHQRHHRLKREREYSQHSLFSVFIP
uniref:Uncharacterized protein n=1 Tax=Arion vulgaris TaxID=1028688 RepID=A0A0B7C1W8_9EUPU